MASPAADELVIRVGIIGAHLVAIIRVIVLVLIVITVVGRQALTWLQWHLQQQECESEEPRGSRFPQPSVGSVALGHLPPPPPHCTANSAAAVPSPPACRLAGSAQSPPSWD